MPRTCTLIPKQKHHRYTAKVV